MYDNTLYFYLFFIWAVSGLISILNIIQLIWRKLKVKEVSKILFVFPIFFLFITIDLVICKYRSDLTEQNLLILDKVFAKEKIDNERDLNVLLKNNSILCQLLCYPISYHKDINEISFTIRPLGPRVDFNYKNHTLNYAE
ncbi:hypothetical protein EHQ82_05230 [Leptospira selangorensis]|uniref:Uncharacterized protein n=1 Tax=Leptospira selangorensis TaxID=2484982 RepID=A0ABY2NFQ0_9LEPT|nr:hypothetical protein EHQ82_05230 [Leptospira selangorensis]